MDEINLSNVSKRFMREWVFRDVNLTFYKNNSYVITGPNGSGKSTLLQVVSSFITPTKGTINFLEANKPLDISQVHKKISISAPYMELPEEFSPNELIDFHKRFKPLIGNISNQEFLSEINLLENQNKQISKFSSGMKQRLKLGLAIMSDSSLLLLDEPTSNLDHESKAMYSRLISKYNNDRITIVCSNDIKDEFDFCNFEIKVSDFK